MYEHRDQSEVLTLNSSSTGRFWGLGRWKWMIGCGLELRTNQCAGAAADRCQLQQDQWEAHPQGQELTQGAHTNQQIIVGLLFLMDFFFRRL